jgi:hypothetical protein
MKSAEQTTWSSCDDRVDCQISNFCLHSALWWAFIESSSTHQESLVFAIDEGMQDPFVSTNEKRCAFHFLFLNL